MTVKEKADKIWDMEVKIRNTKDEEEKQLIEDEMVKFIFSLPEKELYEIDEYIIKHYQAES